MYWGLCWPHKLGLLTFLFLIFFLINLVLPLSNFCFDHFWFLWRCTSLADALSYICTLEFIVLYLCFSGLSAQLYINLPQSGTLTFSSLWICIRFKLMLVTHGAITLPSVLTTWNVTSCKHLVLGCITNSSQDPITRIFLVVYVYYFSSLVQDWCNCDLCTSQDTH